MKSVLEATRISLGLLLVFTKGVLLTMWRVWYVERVSQRDVQNNNKLDEDILSPKFSVLNINTCDGEVFDAIELKCKQTQF
jgi:hypothetical protein